MWTHGIRLTAQSNMPGNEFDYHTAPQNDSFAWHLIKDNVLSLVRERGRVRARDRQSDRARATQTERLAEGDVRQSRRTRVMEHDV